MRYRDENSQLKSHIRSLRWIAGVQLVLMIGLWHGWERSKEAIRIHIPPDLRGGAVVGADQAKPPHVFTFAGYLFQQLNRWPENGADDFGAKVYQLSAYLTPQFKADLLQDLNLRGKRGELSGRTRSVQLMSAYADQRVDLESAGVWTVHLDVNIQETVRGMNVKSVDLRYPLRVVRYAVDPEQNPWGLALDGYAGDGPRRLTQHELTQVGR